MILPTIQSFRPITQAEGEDFLTKPLPLSNFFITATLQRLHDTSAETKGRTHIVLGHANTTTTMERYVHSSMGLKRINRDKLTAAGL